MRLDDDVAIDVIDSFGEGNILYTLSSFFIWDENNPVKWNKAHEEIIKRRIHSHLHKRNLKSSKVDSILKLIKTKIFSESVEFDRVKESVNVLNGKLSFVDGEFKLLPHDKSDFNLTVLPITYDPTARAPKFEQFLREIFLSDPDMMQKISCVLQAIGYSLIRSTKQEKFFILVGDGANGKSVLLHVLEKLIGTENVSAVSLPEFRNKFQRAHLFGKLVNIITETSEGSELPDAEIKSITSGERITVENKFAHPFDFKPYCKLWFATNHLPYSKDHSSAISRRAIILTFNRKFEEHEQNKSLKFELENELPGILNLALEALKGLMGFGQFTVPASTREIVEEWKRYTDQVLQFVEDKCEFGTSEDFKIESSKIFKDYKQWATENGIARHVNHNNLTTRLKRFGVTTAKSTGGKRYLYGIKLKDTY